MVPFAFKNLNESMNNDSIENQNEFTESTETSGLNFKINI